MNPSSGLKEEKLYWSNGQLMIHKFYRDGQLDEKYHQWYDNGAPWIFLSFRTGRWHGLRKEWYDHGQISIEEFFENGKRQGTYRWYYPNGIFAMKRSHQNNEIVGECKRWHMDGKLMECVYRKDGKIIDDKFAWKKKQIFLILRGILYRQSRELTIRTFLISDLADI